MPIVIQELISSDTISQAVNKINFNFDQLILNGGGPAGPPGPAGPTGPVGGRGIHGTSWYKDNTLTPGVDPNTLIILGIEEEDYYLQSNGQVWQYNGTVWIQTVINLTGPQGIQGLSFGFNFAGGFPVNASINNQNVAYPIPMPGGVSGGADSATNQGVSALLIGAVASNQLPPPGIGPFTSAFQIPDVMTKSLDSSVLSTLIHQKDSSSSAIRFMGGGDIPTDNYEQLVVGLLTNITLGIDDSLVINVPKAATTPSNQQDLIGFNLNTIRKGQQFYAGKHINFLSGTDPIVSPVAGEISDISFVVNTSNPQAAGKFSVTVAPPESALFQAGGNIVIPATTIKTGKILGEASQIGLVANNTISLKTGPSQILVIPSLISTSSTVFSLTTTGNINMLTASGKLAVTAGAAAASALFEVGTGITIPVSSIKTGKISGVAGEIGLVAATSVLLKTGLSQILVSPAIINIASTIGQIFMSTTGVQPIGISAGGEIGINTVTGGFNLTAVTGISMNTTGGKFRVSQPTVASPTSALFEVGTGITIPVSSTKTGKILGEAGEIGLVAATLVSLRTTNSSIQVSPATIGIVSTTGQIFMSTGGVQPIGIIAGGDISMAAVTGGFNLTALTGISMNTTGGKFRVSQPTVASPTSALFEVGTGITIPATTTKTGKILGEASQIGLIAATTVQLVASSNSINMSAGITINANTGNLALASTADDINIVAGDDLFLSAGGVIDINAGADLFLNAAIDITLNASLIAITGTTQIVGPAITLTATTANLNLTATTGNINIAATNPASNVLTTITIDSSDNLLLNAGGNILLTADNNIILTTNSGGATFVQDSFRATNLTPPNLTYVLTATPTSATAGEVVVTGSLNVAGTLGDFSVSRQARFGVGTPFKTMYVGKIRFNRTNTNTGTVQIIAGRDASGNPLTIGTPTFASLYADAIINFPTTFPSGSLVTVICSVEVADESLNEFTVVCMDRSVNSFRLRMRKEPGGPLWATGLVDASFIVYGVVPV